MDTVTPREALCLIQRTADGAFLATIISLVSWVFITRTRLRDTIPLPRMSRGKIIAGPVIKTSFYPLSAAAPELLLKPVWRDSCDRLLLISGPQVRILSREPFFFSHPTAINSA